MCLIDRLQRFISSVDRRQRFLEYLPSGTPVSTPVWGRRSYSSLLQRAAEERYELPATYLHLVWGYVPITGSAADVVVLEWGSSVVTISARRDLDDTIRARRRLPRAEPREERL